MDSALSRRGLLFSMALGPTILRAHGGQNVTVGHAFDRLLMWRRVMDDASIEHAAVESMPDGIALSGTVLATEGGSPLRVDYRLLVDSNWRSRSLDVVQEFDGERRSLTLTAGAGGRWLLNGRESPDLSDCVDIDLSLSPITNALPLNRLDIARVGVGEIVAAWVRFPQLTAEPAHQRYVRLSPSVYRYASLASGFTATIRVDDLGFPIEYEGVWKRVGTGRVIPGRTGRVATSVAHDGFVNALLADGPSPELGEAASVFGFLVGGWSASVRDINTDGTVRTGRGEWWFSWVLEGRALQDVWISPPRRERGHAKPPSAANDRYGTTVRRFDRSDNEWKIVWINPVSGAENHLRGGRDGDGITLVGEDAGRPIRWRFVDIRSAGFTWQGDRQSDDGREWTLQAEFQLTRIV